MDSSVELSKLSPRTFFGSDIQSSRRLVRWLLTLTLSHFAPVLSQVFGVFPVAPSSWTSTAAYHSGRTWRVRFTLVQQPRRGTISLRANSRFSDFERLLAFATSTQLIKLAPDRLATVVSSLTLRMALNNQLGCALQLFRHLRGRSRQPLRHRRRRLTALAEAPTASGKDLISEEDV
jgi:hypothetical protein